MNVDGPSALLGILIGAGVFGFVHLLHWLIARRRERNRLKGDCDAPTSERPLRRIDTIPPAGRD